MKTVQTDVAIIGAGSAGLPAYRAAKAADGGAFASHGNGASQSSVPPRSSGYDLPVGALRGHTLPDAIKVYLEAGNRSVVDLIGDIRLGVYVTELIGHGVNGVTGDYSRGAAGFWIEDGRIAFPVSEVTIAGNLKDMFASLIPASDLEFRHGTNAPTVRIEGMTLAGA